MRNHLRSVHKKTGNENTVSLKQKSMTDYQQSKRVLGGDMYNRLNRALALACAVDLRPISMVEVRGFRNFCNLLNPSYSVPCSTTVTKQLMLIYDEIKKDVLEHMKDATVSFTTDLWTSIGTRGYITVTAHYINNCWKLHTKVLATRPLDEKHTGEAIATSLTCVKEEFSITKFGGLTSDNAANMVCAGKQMEKLVHWFCFSHGLQLAVQAGLKDNAIQRAIGAGRTLVSRFHRSSAATLALKEAQKRNKDSNKPLSLVQSVVTRWNSTYFMAIRLITLRVPIFEVLHNASITSQADRRKLELSDNDWKVLEDIIPILQPLADATEALTKENEPTFSQVYVLLNALIAFLKLPQPMESNSSKKLREVISKSLKSQFRLLDDGTPEDCCQPALAATFLDPRYKGLTFLSETQKTAVTDYVQGLIPVTQDGEERELQGSQPIKTESMSILDCLIGNVDTVDLTSQRKSSEMKLYEVEPVPYALRDPLEWWRVNEMR